MKEYRSVHIGLSLPEPEALAISQMAQRELRDLKSQARFLLRSKLIELGLLVDETPTTNQSIPSIQD